jgi:hypothetical protein
MTLTGPQKYPGASLSLFFGDRYEGSAMEVNVCVWHTTEGRTVYDYSGGAVAPTLTAAPDMSAKKLRWYQHYDIDRSARALVNAPGGVETNTNNAVQIELVGTCDPNTNRQWISEGRSGEFIYWPDAPEWALQELADFVNWLHDNHDVPIRSTVTWKPYPASYGTNNGVRLSGAEWNTYTGHLGHEHVTENLHGDPGDLKFARVIQLATGSGADMALSADDLKNIFNADLVPAATPPFNNSDYFAADGKTVANGTWTLKYTLSTITRDGRDTIRRVKDTQADVAAVKGAVADLGKQVAAVSAKVDAVATGGVDLDALAKKVADLLAKRLES